MFFDADDLLLFDHLSRFTDAIANHPGVDLLVEYERRLPRAERRLLRTAVNRKVLSWAVEKKRLGQSVRPELAALSLGGMRFRHWLHAATLLVPQPYYDRLRGWVK